MRALAQSRSRVLMRLGVLAVIAAGLAGCIADTARFSDNPFTNSMANRPSADVTGSVPGGQVESQSLPPPAQTASPGGVAGGGGGIGSYQPPAASQPAVAAAPAPRVAAATPARPAGAAPGPHLIAPAVTHSVAPGETLSSLSRRYGKSRVEL